jgi:hypothetical protein
MSYKFTLDHSLAIENIHDMITIDIKPDTRCSITGSEIEIHGYLTFNGSYLTDELGEERFKGSIPLDITLPYLDGVANVYPEVVSFDYRIAGGESLTLNLEILLKGYEIGTLAQDVRSDAMDAWVDPIVKEPIIEEAVIEPFDITLPAEQPIASSVKAPTLAEEVSNLDRDQKTKQEVSNLDRDQKAKQEVSNLDRDQKAEQEVLNLDQEQNTEQEVSNLDRDQNTEQEVPNLDQEDSTEQEVFNFDGDQSTEQEVSNLDRDQSTEQEVSKLNQDQSTEQEVSKLNQDQSTEQEVSNLDRDQSTEQEVSKLNQEQSVEQEVSNLDRDQNTEQEVSNLDQERSVEQEVAEEALTVEEEVIPYSPVVEIDTRIVDHEEMEFKPPVVEASPVEVVHDEPDLDLIREEELISMVAEEQIAPKVTNTASALMDELFTMKRGTVFKEPMAVAVEDSSTSVDIRVMDEETNDAELVEPIGVVDSVARQFADGESIIKMVYVRHESETLGGLLERYSVTMDDVWNLSDLGDGVGVGDCVMIKYEKPI